MRFRRFGRSQNPENSPPPEERDSASVNIDPALTPQEIARQERDEYMRRAKVAAELARQVREEMFGYIPPPANTPDEEAEATEEARQQESEQQETAEDPMTSSRVNILLPDLLTFNSDLNSFEEREIRYVVSHILSKRSTGMTDWHIHLGFHPDRQPNLASASVNFQISRIIIRGQKKDSFYPFS